MKKIERFQQYLVIPEMITHEGVAKARYQFTKIFTRQPSELHMGGTAFNDICTQYGITKVPDSLTNETIQGLIIIIDPECQPTEWFVGNSGQVVREVKEK